MKQTRICSLLLVLTLLFAMLPLPANAANATGEQILTSFGVAGTEVVKLDADTKAFSLPVLAGTSDTQTINLTESVTRTYDTSKYRAVTITSSASTARVGTNFTLKLTYQKVGDSDNTVYSCSYTVAVIAGTSATSSFSGDITVEVPIGTSYKLSSDMFEDLFTQGSGSKLYGVSFSGVSISGLSLKTAAGTYQTGTVETCSAIDKMRIEADIETLPGSEVTYLVTGYSDKTTKVEGTVSLTVKVTSEGQKDFPLHCLAGLNIEIPADDLYKACRTITGNPLSYIYLNNMVSDGCGDLYGTYTSKTKTLAGYNTKYYYKDGDDLISNLTFVTTKVGSAQLYYTAYDTTGEHFDGVIDLISGNFFTLNDTVTAGRTLTLSASKLNQSFTDTLASGLKYLHFDTLPSESQGELIYAYGTDDEKAVDSDTAYYRNPTDETLPSLDRITFIPEEDYSGTVSLRLDCTGEGRTAIGYLYIDVTAPASSAAAEQTAETVKEEETDPFPNVKDGRVTYTSTGDAVKLSAADLSEACQQTIDTPLSYIRIALPMSSAGTLYYNRTAPTVYADKVTGTQYYNMNGRPAIGKISFLPQASYTGTVNLSYLGFDENDKSYSGTISITVTHDKESKIFTDVGSSYSWAVPAIDFLYDNQITVGTGDKVFSPAGTISRGDFILMLYRACGLKDPSSDEAPYSDVKTTDYYCTAIASAKELGILNDKLTKFSPKDPITREDAMVCAQKALAVVGIQLEEGTKEDLSAFSDADDISDGAVGIIASLVNAGVINGSNGQIKPKATMSRAEMAVVLYRILTLGI